MRTPDVPNIVIGSWQAEAVLVAACVAAALWLATRGRAPGPRWAAAALALLAVAALLGGLLFAGIAPSVAPAHEAMSRLFATVGFAVIAVALVGGARPPWWLAAGKVVLLAVVALAIPLAPVVLAAHAIALWKAPARRDRHAVALVAMALVIAGQVAIPAGAARLDALHVTLAVWAVALAAAMG